MKKKQMIWLVVALVVFSLTGYLGVRSALSLQEKSAGVLSEALSEATSALKADSGADFPNEPFLARVDINGTIMDPATAGLSVTGTYDHGYTLDILRSLESCPDNVGILLYVNSPGGSMNASDELYLRLMEYKEKTGRPIYCYFGDTACSGGYYAAMAADEIWANRNSLCVNIGVYIATYNFSQLFEKLGIQQMVFRSSENKGIGLPGTAWTEEQKAIYQSIVDIYYEQFLDVVAKGRSMTPEEVRLRDDGREMVAPQALKAGFIDGIGGYEDYEKLVSQKLGSVTVASMAPPTNPLFSLLDYLTSALPQSDAQVIQKFADAHSGMVVMAYDENF